DRRHDGRERGDHLREAKAACVAGPSSYRLACSLGNDQRHNGQDPRRDSRRVLGF
ncbi:hypothetical protein FOZ62_009021, partial [Perkinsus olseni]